MYITIIIIFIIIVIIYTLGQLTRTLSESQWGEGGGKRLDVGRGGVGSSSTRQPNNPNSVHPSSLPLTSTDWRHTRLVQPYPASDLGIKIDVTLQQACRADRATEISARLVNQWTHWIRQNPFTEEGRPKHANFWKTVCFRTQFDWCPLIFYEKKAKNHQHPDHQHCRPTQ